MTYTIKPLEWQHTDYGRNFANISFATYYNVHLSAFTKDWQAAVINRTIKDVIGGYISKDEAKAACQLHYESELKKLLTPVNKFKQYSEMSLSEKHDWEDKHI